MKEPPSTHTNNISNSTRAGKRPTSQLNTEVLVDSHGCKFPSTMSRELMKPFLIFRTLVFQWLGNWEDKRTLLSYKRECIMHWARMWTSWMCALFRAETWNNQITAATILWNRLQLTSSLNWNKSWASIETKTPIMIS